MLDKILLLLTRQVAHVGIIRNHLLNFSHGVLLPMRKTLTMDQTLILMKREMHTFVDFFGLGVDEGILKLQLVCFLVVSFKAD